MSIKLWFRFGIQCAKDPIFWLGFLKGAGTVGIIWIIINLINHA